MTHGQLIQRDTRIRSADHRGRDHQLHPRLPNLRPAATLHDGRYPELTATAARVDAGELRRKDPRAGHDSMGERLQNRLEPTLGDLATAYLESARLRSKRPNTVRDYTRMIDKIVRRELGSLRLKAMAGAT